LRTGADSPNWAKVILVSVDIKLPVKMLSDASGRRTGWAEIRAARFYTVRRLLPNDN